MKKLLLLLYLFFVSISLFAQTIARPKLIIGIVVDQMRWDFLYRFANRYSDGGFKRLLQNGFNCDNTYINYTPSVTACGHTAIFTGSVPAITGITDNSWLDRSSGEQVYCTQDKTVKTVGSNATTAGQMSPANLLTTTIGDELRLATNFQSKVIGIALKDRGSILPAGHSANAAYWYDEQSGNWITSSYYMTALPQWATAFNDKKITDQLYKQNWNTLYDVATYKQSTKDIEPYEAKPFGQSFPYKLEQFAGKNYAAILATPYGNTLTLALARAAIEGEGMGSVNDRCDLLTISLSSTDYVGHTFGPNSIEAEDTYLRLDKDLSDFLTYLDTKIGRDQYLLFLSADHGVAHVPGFLKENKIPAGNFRLEVVNQLNQTLKSKYGNDQIITTAFDYQLFLNRNVIESLHLNEKEVKQFIINELTKKDGISAAVDLKEIRQSSLPAPVLEMLANGYYAERSGDIEYLLQPQWLEEFAAGGTTHGLWYPYDTKIPLLWFGWSLKKGTTLKRVAITDIAPTLASLLHIQPPSGSIGQVIEELVK